MPRKRIPVLIKNQNHQWAQFICHARDRGIKNLLTKEEFIEYIMADACCYCEEKKQKNLLELTG